jgi:glyoxylase-like metal-dependent hydrolase (beta-lactamase superfamily II)
MKMTTLDLNFQNRPNTIASYLVEGSAGTALVETGPGSCLPNLLSQLASHGYGPADVRHVLVTHIHLDHAGAAGWWAQQGAQVYVHHVGAPHLIDPSKLLASASRIYGDQMDTLWGEMVPAPAERITTVFDGDVIAVGELRFTALDTPGHASHHHVYVLPDPANAALQVAFTGDAAGIHIPGADFIDLPAPPPEFSREKWLATIDRLLDQQLAAIYPTHFGRLDDWRLQLLGLAELIQEAADLVRDLLEDGLERDDILTRYLGWHLDRARAADMPEALFQRYEAANPHYMSVDGLIRYWRKRWEKEKGIK